MFVCEEVGQAVHDAQRQAVLVEEIRLLQPGQDAGEHVEHEGVGKGPFDIGADAVHAGELHGEPALHAAALDHDELGGERG